MGLSTWLPMVLASGRHNALMLISPTSSNPDKGLQVELEGSPVTVLKRGSYFGELALLRDMRRTASVRCISETCDLFVLTKVSLTMHQCLHVAEPQELLAPGITWAFLAKCSCHLSCCTCTNRWPFWVHSCTIKRLQCGITGWGQ